VDTLREHLQRQVDDMRGLLQERYATQTKALDAAFLAQQTAMTVAFTAADKAVQAALEAAEKAVGKAEIAAEKRFDSVNEFRAQLADQATTFMPRAEAEAMVNRNSERIQEVTDRINRSEGRGVGLNAGWVYLLAGIAAIGTIVSIYLALKP
jgi:hypothetical protein